LGKAALFLSAGAIIHQSGIRDIRSLGGLAGKMPISAVAFTIGVMSIAGIPPTIGFISKSLVFMGSINRGLANSTIDLAVTLAALVSTALTIGYTTWTIRRIFFGPTPEHLENVTEAPLTMTVPLIIISVLSVVAGIYPKVILDLLFQIIKALVQG
jgi:NADH-quinone oxidoreductase subunit M